MKNNGLNTYVKLFFTVSAVCLVALGAFIAATPDESGWSPSRVVFAEFVILAFILCDVVLTVYVLSTVERVDFRDGYCLIDTGLTRKSHSYFLNYNEVYEIESRRGIFGNRPELIIIRAEVNGKKKTFRYRTGVRRRADELTFDQCKKHFTHAAVKE